VDADVKQSILIEGFTPEEILHLPDEQMEALVFTGGPLLFRAGTAEILGEFRIREKRLVVEMAHIEGGGEGVLPTLIDLMERYAEKRRLNEVEWIVHALTCAKPNLKLRRVMERRWNFVVEDVPGIGLAYHLILTVRPQFQSSPFLRRLLNQ
jgi:hypothetical protein